MILSNVDIRRELERGSLRIEPLSSDTIRENGVDLRLGWVFCTPRGTIDSRSVSSSDYECTEVADGDYYVVPPNSRVLAHTVETIELPSYLVGLVNLRSTYARMGLAVPPTVVDAGFRGQLTVEIIGSSVPVKIYPGDRFIHLVLLRTESPSSTPYSGVYQGQRGVTLPMRVGRH